MIFGGMTGSFHLCVIKSFVRNSCLKQSFFFATHFQFLHSAAPRAKKKTRDKKQLCFRTRYVNSYKKSPYENLAMDLAEVKFDQS